MHTAEHGPDLMVVKPGILLVIWCQVRSMDKNKLVVQLYQLSGPYTLILWTSPMFRSLSGRKKVFEEQDRNRDRYQGEQEARHHELVDDTPVALIAVGEHG